MDYYRSGFFWQSDDHRKKYRLAKWSILCQPKELGGLGIKNLDLQSGCLLNKWLYKLINQGHLAKFIKKQVPKEPDHCSGAKESGGLSLLGWLVKVKDTFINFGTFRLNDGKQIRFWEDKWIGNHTLSQQYPALYNIVKSMRQ